MWYCQKKISMEAKRIEVIKDWPKPKSVRNIQIFLGFTNFYRQLIQGLSKIAALFTLMLKTTGSLDKPAPSRNNGSRSASSRNNNSRPASRKNDGDDEVHRFGVDKDDVEYAKKLEKLSKSENLSKLRKSKSEKMFKSQNLANSG